MKFTALSATILALFVIFISACDQSTPAHFEIVDTAEGINDNGYVYLDLTVENTSNGTGMNVQCVVTATESRSGEALAEKTVLFDKGVNIKPEEQVTKRVELYNPAVLDALVESEDIEIAGETESIPLDPIVKYTFDLSWEDVGLD